MRTDMQDHTGSARGTVLMARDSGADVNGPSMQGRFDEWCIARALDILRRRLVERPAMSSPDDVKSYLVMKYAAYRHECFVVLFLDAAVRLLTMEEMFRGTLTSTSIYPREIVRRALELNACAVIFAHNHPSGRLEPSRSDEQLTATLKAALALVDVRVLDHLIVAGSASLSMAERGLL